MICYRDMTFCCAPCATACHVKLTDEVRAAAARWWDTWGSSDEAPIAMADMHEGCADYAAVAPGAGGEGEGSR